MGETTNIAWCDATFNPWVGCEKISPGCVNCYAENWAKRGGHPELWNGFRRRTTEANWRQPMKWQRLAEASGERKRVFCASLADVFDNAADEQWRSDLFKLIRATPNLDWLLLTKRIGNVAAMLDKDMGLNGYPNVWLGITVVNQEEADRDVPKLLKIPAHVRFLSIEPMLGPITLFYDDEGCLRGPGVIRDGHMSVGTSHDPPEGDDTSYPGIDWVICGGESGGRARCLELPWALGLANQCNMVDVPFFMKQLSQDYGPHFKDFNRFPDDLQVREWP